MKRKAVIGGTAALVVIVIAAGLCYLAGNFISDRLSRLNEGVPRAERPPRPTPAPPRDPSRITYGSVHLTFGNPGAATPNPADSDSYLLLNDYYAVSYNRFKMIPNWAAWRLSRENLGPVDRQNDFRPNEELPKNWKNVYPSYYIRSGYDRGHLVPSADRTESVAANSATFLMTNIVPQKPDLNQGPWRKLESYSRSLARRKNVLYIYAGGYGTKGKIRQRITVPSNFWKVIVVLPEGLPVTAIGPDTRVIAVDMPNSQGIKNQNWRKYRTTVRRLEQKTGYDFFADLPPGLQGLLEIRVDTR